MDKVEIPQVDEAKLATLPPWAADLVRAQFELIKRLMQRNEVLEAHLR